MSGVQLIFRYIIFFRLTHEEKRFTEAFAPVAAQMSRGSKLYFAEKAADFPEYDRAHLIVTGSDLTPGDEDELYHSGFSRVVEWGMFREKFSDLLSIRIPVQTGRVLLAFLEPLIERRLAAVFELYGIEVDTVSEVSQFNEMLYHEPDYLVFDVDPETEISRDKILRKVDIWQCANSHVAVSCIKDFSKGSLFSDVSSSLKKITPVLLNAREYMLFISRYLFRYNLNKIWELDTAGLESPDEKKMMRKKFSFSKPLRNSRRKYEAGGNFREFVPAGQLANLNEHLQNLHLRRSLFLWLEDYLASAEEMNNRASFSFINGRSEEADSFVKLTENEAPAEEKKVSAQFSGNFTLPEIRTAGGPR